MQRSAAGNTLIVLGLFIILVFATADLFGLGADPRFGAKQITGCLVGLAIMAGGGFLRSRG